MAMRFQPVAAEGGSSTVNPFGSTRTVTGTPGSTAPLTAPVSDLPPSITMVPFFSTLPDQSITPEDGTGGCTGLGGASTFGGTGSSFARGAGWAGSSFFLVAGRFAGWAPALTLGLDCGATGSTGAGGAGAISSGSFGISIMISSIFAGR